MSCNTTAHIGETLRILDRSSFDIVEMQLLRWTLPAAAGAVALLAWLTGSWELPAPYQVLVQEVLENDLPTPSPVPQNKQRQLVARKLFQGLTGGVETVIVGSGGRLYLANEQGQVLVAAPPNEVPVEWAYTGGRSLGGKLDADGNLILCNVPLGLIKVSAETRQTTILAARVTAGPGAGSEILFADDLDIASNGVIYFSDLSTVQPVRGRTGAVDVLAASTANLFQGKAGGRLLAYDPATQETRVLINDVWGANGVALAQHESFVAVASTNSMRVLRYWLKGPKAGSSDVLVHSLPSFLDGVSRSTSDPSSFWVASPFGASGFLGPLMRSRLLRWVAGRVPPRLLHGLGSGGGVFKVSESGEVLLYLQDTSHSIRTVTAVTEYDNKLYLGQLGSDSIAVADLPD